MKYMWRITKYNPEYRDEDDKYLLDEWTSFSDIGNYFDGSELTSYEYEKIEKCYINSIICLMDCNKINRLKIEDLEVYEEKNVDTLVNTISEGDILSKEKIIIIIRHVLREQIWCKLVYNKRFFVHFGYDYYMYIGSSAKCEYAIKEIKNKRLFVESIKSPYLY